MAQVCLGVSVIGFAPTYWHGLVTGTFRGGPVVHMHAFLFYAWMALLILQTALVAQNRVVRHREFGLIGVALAAILVVSGMAVSIGAGLRFEQAGFGREGRAFLIVSWSSMALFGALVSLAVANASQTDRHRRLMLAATISMLGAPVARWILLLAAPEVLSSGTAAPPPPVFVSLPPALLGDLLFIPMLMYDRRTLGRFHSTTVKAAFAVIATQILIIPFSATNAWDHFADLVLQFNRQWL